MLKLVRRIKPLYRDTLVPILILLLFVAGTCFAQMQGGGQFSQMREKYKYTSQLMRMVRHIDIINKDPKYALSADQAKKVLAVLQPLRSKSKLSQDQAKDTLKKLKPIFNVNQLNAMAKIKQPTRQGQGQNQMGGQGGPGRTGGQAGNQGNRPRFDQNAMKDFNPFYAKADSKDEFAVQRAKRWNAFFSDMQNKSKGIKDSKASASKKPGSSSKVKVSKAKSGK